MTYFKGGVFVFACAKKIRFSHDEAHISMWLHRTKKTWEEVLVLDRKKLGMDSADPQNRSELRGCLRGRLVR